MPHWSAKPCRQGPLCDECIIRGFVSIDHVRNNGEVTRRLSLARFSERVELRPVGNGMSSSPRRESSIVHREGLSCRDRESHLLWMREGDEGMARTDGEQAAEWTEKLASRILDGQITDILTAAAVAGLIGRPW